MRKIKTQQNKIKEKIIVRKVNENKPTYVLSKCLLELPLAIKRAFNVSSKEIYDYVKDNQKNTIQKRSVERRMVYRARGLYEQMA